MSKHSRVNNYSDHHELPQNPAWTKEHWSNHPNNIKRLKDVKHRAIHDLFENLMFPEQVITLIELSDTALKPEIKEEFLEFIKRRDIHNPRQRYKDECIK